jgi:hypothetical protein
MNVQLINKSVESYTLEVNIEEEGQTYRASIHYDTGDGFEVTFLDDKGKIIAKPQWAIDYEEEENYGGDSLGYYLEDKIGGFFDWTEGENQ